MEELQHIKIADLFPKILIGDSDIVDADWNNLSMLRLFEHIKPVVD